MKTSPSESDSTPMKQVVKCVVVNVKAYASLSPFGQNERNRLRGEEHYNTARSLS
jgi:hypothetical protein